VKETSAAGTAGWAYCYHCRKHGPKVLGDVEIPTPAGWSRNSLGRLCEACARIVPTPRRTDEFGDPRPVQEVLL
jgi:hypothetical protein